MQDDRYRHIVSREQMDITIGELRKILRVWHYTANRLVNLTILFGILAIVSSVLVSVYTSTDLMCKQVIKILACISTASITLLTAFNVVQKGNNARTAWRILNAALYRFENGLYTMEQLIHCYEIGERLVGDTDFSFGVAPKSEKVRVDKKGRKK